jgi:hypothetical protein
MEEQLKPSPEVDVLKGYDTLAEDSAGFFDTLLEHSQTSGKKERKRYGRK